MAQKHKALKVIIDVNFLSAFNFEMSNNRKRKPDPIWASLAEPNAKRKPTNTDIGNLQSILDDDDVTDELEIERTVEQCLYCLDKIAIKQDLVTCGGTDNCQAKAHIYCSQLYYKTRKHCPSCRVQQPVQWIKEIQNADYTDPISGLDRSTTLRISDFVQNQDSRTRTKDRLEPSPLKKETTGLFGTTRSFNKKQNNRKEMLKVLSLHRYDQQVPDLIIAIRKKELELNTQIQKLF